MSFDFYIGEEDFNYTWNVSKMWYDCYPEQGIRIIVGLRGQESVPILRKLREHMENNRERMLSMEPSNGWGSYKGALAFVSSLIEAALENPDDVWEGG